MAFPTNPSPGDSYTDEYGTVWVYAGTVNGWYRQEVSTPNDTNYTAAISGPAGSNTQVQFNDNGELGGDSGLTYNKTTDALSGGAFIPTGSTVPTNGVYLPSANSVAISTNGTGRLFVDASGNVGVGTTSPSSTLDLNGDCAVANTRAYQVKDSGGTTRYAMYMSGSLSPSAGNDLFIGNTLANSLILYTNSAERARIDSSGRLLVGTSSALSDHFGGSGVNLQLAGTSYQASAAQFNAFGSNQFLSPHLVLNKARGTQASPSGVLENDRLGGIIFTGYAANTANQLAARIECYVDGEPGTAGDTSDLPGRLVFSTTADGASSPTERLRIDSSGRLLVGTSSTPQSFAGSALTGVQIEKSGNSATRSLALISNASSNFPPSLHFGRSRGTSNGAVTSVASGDSLGQFIWGGADGTTAFIPAASVGAEVDGTPGANDMPGRLVFSVTADGASSPSEAVRISQNRITQFQNDIIPGTDNAYQVGQSGRRWSVIFAGTGTINTSDANLKQDIEDLEQAELNVATTIKGLIKKFRFIDAVAGKGNDARIHVGVIAQEVEQAFIGEGLDPRRYGLFCEDTLEDGSKRLGIRYDELLAFVIAAL